MPCTCGGAPVSMELKQVTVRAGYTVCMSTNSLPSARKRSMVGVRASSRRSLRQPSMTMAINLRHRGRPLVLTTAVGALGTGGRQVKNQRCANRATSPIVSPKPKRAIDP